MNIFTISKAFGPDCIPGRILQNLARELAPVLHFIFEQSLNTQSHQAEPEGLPTEVKGDSLFLLGTLLC